MKKVLCMILLLSSLSAGRGGRDSLYDRNKEHVEAHKNDYMRYIPSKAPLKKCCCSEEEEDEGEDD